MSQLSFASLHRPGSGQAGGYGGSQTERHSLDFLVDGVSLYSQTNAAQYDFIGLLGWSPYEQNRGLVRQLLLEIPNDAGAGRQSLFVCAECGDLGCGSITARITNLDDRYLWSDFAYENNYDPSMTDRVSFASIGPFAFDAYSYRQALLSILEEESS